MLIEADKGIFQKHFPVDPNPFVSCEFIEHNKSMVERIVRLMDNAGEPVIGLVAGIKDRALRSPYSAPFGGFHFRKENLYITEIDRFLESLKDYAVAGGLDRIEIATPPDIYHMSFNAKVSNSLIRHGFLLAFPEITSWVNLRNFTGTYRKKNSREYFRQAQRNGLTFSLTKSWDDKKKIYDLIWENRARFGRPIYMTFDDIVSMESIWPVDFFKVETSLGHIAASAIFYRNHPEICFAVFWGDNDEGRPLRAMDFLLLNLYTHYRDVGFYFMDLGRSTEEGTPNEGLLRFKESHEAVSSLRFKFEWRV